MSDRMVRKVGLDISLLEQNRVFAVMHYLEDRRGWMTGDRKGYLMFFDKVDHSHMSSRGNRSGRSSS